jgi:hypothetical protein
MKKQEIVFREICCGYTEGRRSFTQLELARTLGLSLSTVNAALSNLRDISAVRIMQRSFEIIALDRLLLYWATHRNLKNDIIYETRADAPVKEIERNMPGGVAFTAYTAYRALFGESVADYSEVYVYATAEGLSEIKRRFGPSRKIANIIVLEADAVLGAAMAGHKLKRSSVCEAQVFVDLWNAGEWYAKDYVDALSARLGI